MKTLVWLSYLLLIVYITIFTATILEFLPPANEEWWNTYVLFKDPFFVAMSYGVFFFYLWIHKIDRVELWQACFIGAFISFVLIMGQHFFGVKQQLYLLENTGVGLGLYAMYEFARQALKVKGEAQEPAKRFFLIAWLALAFAGLPRFLLYLNMLWHPVTQDQLLYAVDWSFGFSPSFIAGQLYHHLPLVVQSFIRLVYLSLPLACMIVGIAYIQTSPCIFKLLLWELSLIGALGFCLLFICPATGPGWFFGPDFPYFPPQPQLTPQLQKPVVEFPCNALPSLHTAWIYCLWRYAQPTTAGLRYGILGCMIITIIAMLGTGEHYLIDILVGVCLAVGVRGLVARYLANMGRITYLAIMLGFGLGAVWLLLIKFGLAILRFSPVLMWLLFSASFFIILKVEFIMARKQFI